MIFEVQYIGGTIHIEANDLEEATTKAEKLGEIISINQVDL